MSYSNGDEWPLDPQLWLVGLDPLLILPSYNFRHPYGFLHWASDVPDPSILQCRTRRHSLSKRVTASQ